MRRVSLSQFLIEEQRAGRLDADLRLLVEVVARAVKAIAVTISKGKLWDVHGETGVENIQGEVQKKLDAATKKPQTQEMLRRIEKVPCMQAGAAQELDADAVIGVKYGSSQVMSGAAEVIAYGTAVKYK